MSPSPPPELLVFTVTLVLARALVRSVTLRFEEAGAGVPASTKHPGGVPAQVPLLVAAVLIVMSVGSSRSVPVFPNGALVSTVP